jgi:signal transduction histidine kinase
MTHLAQMENSKDIEKTLKERIEFEELISDFSAALININQAELSNALGAWIKRISMFLSVDRCTIGEYSEDQSIRTLSQYYLHPDLSDHHPSHKTISIMGMYRHYQQEGMIKINRLPDDLPDTLDSNDRERLLQIGAKSIMGLPLMAGNRIIGDIVFYSFTSEMMWSEILIRRLNLVAEIISNAFIRDKTQRELVRYHQQLEHLVEERSAELKEAQEDLLRSERLATLGKLTAMVSHELRNPLGTIRASLYAIRQRCTDSNVGIEKALDRAERGVIRCDRIIEELLDFSRIREPIKEITGIDDWLMEMIKEERPPQGVRLEADCHSQAKLKIDRERFRRCLINLLNNAYQAIEQKRLPPGQGLVMISSRFDEERNQIEIIVSDNGVGFDPAQTDKIFEPLFSTKSFGVGLGVPIAHQIVQQHGGKMSMDSKPGHGAKVLIQLPNLV